MFLLLRLVRALVALATSVGLVVAAVVALFVTDLLVSVGAEGTGAMGRTLPACDGRALAESLTYRLRDPDRGDVAALRVDRAADGSLLPTSDGHELVARRIVGVPGDTVAARGGVLYVNDRPYGVQRTAAFPEVTLGGGRYFVLADDRTVLDDSRSFGPVDREAIDGKVRLVVWPLDRVGIPGEPDSADPPGIRCGDG